MAVIPTTPKNSREVLPKEKTAPFVVVSGSLYTNNLATGAFELVTGSTVRGQIVYLANESILAVDARLTANVTVLSEADRYIVDTVNPALSTHNGQRMLVNATGDRVTNSGTDAPTGIFVQVSVYGTTKIIAKKA